MRRLLLVFTAFVLIGPVLQTGSAHALGIGPIQLPDFDPPVSVHDQPGTRIKPSWLPANLGENATVVLVPGTTDYDGADQLKRSRDIGFYDSADPNDPAYYDPAFIIIGADGDYDNYPAAFGFTVLGVPVNLAGQGTFNESVDLGTEDAVTAATDVYRANPNQPIIVNGYSQSAPVAMNAAYLIHRDSLIPDDKMTVVVGADSRFPNTGVENVVPSLIPGLYTNGDRDPADTGDIRVISYCVRGDATCGVGNPIAHPVSTLVYLAPGFYVHAFLNGDINDYDETAEWTVGNTTYVVLDGGNPWGMTLRDLGLPVPTEFDTALSTLVPVPMPGERATVAGRPVPTPRELQERIYQRRGWKVPVTDPDVVDKQDDQSAAESAAAVPNRIASPTATTKQQSTDPRADGPRYPAEDEKGAQSTTTAEKTAGTSIDDTDDERLPLLYLHGLSTGDFVPALGQFLGSAKGLSASVITKLTETWRAEQHAFAQRDLSSVDYVYLWADGIHEVRLDETRLCLLVLIGVRADGRKELVALTDGYREATESWADLLRDCLRRGMRAPVLAIGDGALGFWGALREVFPETAEQRCWFHKISNVLAALPKSAHRDPRTTRHRRGQNIVWPRR